jgi:hypothetical protein
MRKEKEAEMKTRMILVVVLVVLFALPMALYAQETDPETVVMAAHDAMNAGDVEAALSYYAEDAVLDIVPFNKHTGQDEIRAYFEGNAALNATLEHEVIQVEGNTITLRTWYTDDDLRAMGLNLEGITEVTIEDGKIATETWTATDETMAALEAAMAALPETGGETLSLRALLIALGGLSVAGGWAVASLRRGSRRH